MSDEESDYEEMAVKYEEKRVMKWYEIIQYIK